MHEAEGDGNDADCAGNSHAGLLGVELPSSTATPGRRLTDPALTSDDIGQAWPEISRALGRYLRSRGASPHEVDDITQSVALKALTESRPILNLTAWCIRAARNAHVDSLRRDGRAKFVDLGTSADPAEVVCGRDMCRRAVTAVAALPSVDRQLLLQAANQVRLGDDRKTANARHVRVHRLRRRLRLEVFGPLAGVVAASVASLRSRRLATMATVPAAACLPLLLGPLLDDGRLDRLRPEVSAQSVVMTEVLPAHSQGLTSDQSNLGNGRHETPSTGPAPRGSVTELPASLPDEARVKSDTPIGPAGLEIRSDEQRGAELVCVRDVAPGVDEACVTEPSEKSLTPTL